MCFIILGGSEAFPTSSNTQATPSTSTRAENLPASSDTQISSKAKHLPAISDAEIPSTRTAVNLPVLSGSQTPSLASAAIDLSSESIFFFTIAYAYFKRVKSRFTKLDLE